MLIAIPEPDGKHTAQLVDEIKPLLLVKVDQDLGVRVRLELVPPAEELLSQFTIVVDLAVERDPDGPGLVGKGLATGREPYNAQTAVPESDPRLDMRTIFVGPTVDQQAFHHLDVARVDGFVLVKAVDTADSAHERLVYLPSYPRWLAGCRSGCLPATLPKISR